MKVHGAAGEGSPRYDSDGDDSSSAGSASGTVIGAASPVAPAPSIQPHPAPPRPSHHGSIADKLESLHDKYLSPHEHKPYPHHGQHTANVGPNGHWPQFQQTAPPVHHAVPEWWCPTQETYHHHHLMHHSGAAAAY